MRSVSHNVKVTLLRSFIWIATMLALVLLVAWKTDWQAACWVAVACCASVMVWHLMHVQWLISNLEHNLQNPNQAASPSTLGLWGEAFYLLHRLSRQHNTALTDIKAQQDRFTQAIQASPNAFVMLDDGGRVAWMNGAAQALLGLDAARDTGQNLAYLLRTPAVAALLDSTRMSTPVMVQAQGRTIAVQALPFGEAQTLLLGQDLTEIERTERVRRDFVANVSHELRTPLTVLSGYAELLHDHAEQMPPALREAVTHMVSHTQRMNHLTQDLLQLATLDAGAARLDAQHTESIAVHTWLASVQAATAPLASHSGAAALVFKPVDASWAVQGLSAELHSALSNLVTNALRYTPAGGTVTVRCHRILTNGKAMCQVQVVDTGCGIAAEHLPRLTERFYRVSASRRRDHSVSAAESGPTGTGLGLAIVKHIMQRHNGELIIASELGKGSVFTLQLPLLA